MTRKLVVTSSKTCLIGLSLLVVMGLVSCRRATTTVNPEKSDSVLGSSVVEEPAKDKPIDPSIAFFEQGKIPTIRIVISKSQEQKWREDLRRYVKCKLIESLPDVKKDREENPDASASDQSVETTYSEVAIKVKGAAGSWRELDDKPAFTINVAKHTKGQTFHGVEKFHLNNSVQDESYLSEWLCADLARDMKIPATRVTHARVFLNDRDLGLYVLKEGFDRPFLNRHFGSEDGNLYDGGFLQDLDIDLEKDSGKGPDDHSDLHTLKAACEDPDPKTREPAIERLLNVEAFLTFVAFEMMTCHWDGYTVNKNNYRIYFDPKDGRARFLPHGMDQMFGDPGFPLFEYPPTIVAGAVMHHPEWRARYRKIIEESIPLFEANRLSERLDLVTSRVQPIAAQLGDEFLNAFNERGREFRERVVARHPALKEHLQNGEPMPMEFDESNPVELADWYPAQETGDTQIEDLEPETDQRRYSILVGESNDCVASWRRRVLLAQGRYQLDVTMKTEGVEPRVDDQGTGAGVRISGGKRENALKGDNDWQVVSYVFEVAEAIRNVELVAELRATKGRLLIRPTAKLKRLPSE